MPGLQFQELPAAQVKEITGRLQSQWQIEANALRVKPFKSQQQANAELAKLNAKYQRLEFDSLTQLQQQQQEQERVQQLIRQPREMGRGEEAAERMRLGPEAERLAFPEEPAPFSISEITSPRLMKSIEDFAEAAPTTSEFWTRKENEPKTKQGIINKYLGWRELIQYDAIADKNPKRAQQLDVQWDAYMAGDEKFDEWWSSKKKRQPIVEIRALRTPGKIGKLMRGRITGAEGITPLGESVAKTKPSETVRWEQPIEVASWLTSKLKGQEKAQSPESLRQRGTEEAYKKGKELGYWE